MTDRKCRLSKKMLTFEIFRQGNLNFVTLQRVRVQALEDPWHTNRQKIFLLTLEEFSWGRTQEDSDKDKIIIFPCAFVVFPFLHAPWNVSSRYLSPPSSSGASINPQMLTICFYACIKRGCLMWTGARLGPSSQIVTTHSRQEIMSSRTSSILWILLPVVLIETSGTSLGTIGQFTGEARIDSRRDPRKWNPRRNFAPCCTRVDSLFLSDGERNILLSLSLSDRSENTTRTARTTAVHQLTRYSPGKTASMHDYRWRVTTRRDWSTVRYSQVGTILRREACTRARAHVCVYICVHKETRNVTHTIVESFYTPHICVVDVRSC